MKLKTRIEKLEAGRGALAETTPPVLRPHLTREEWLAVHRGETVDRPDYYAWLASLERRAA